jgi:hypothetical protein
MYEYGTLKLVEVILTRGVEKKGRIMEGINQTGVQYMYMWERHSEIPYIAIVY